VAVQTTVCNLIEWKVTARCTFLAGLLMSCIAADASMGLWMIAFKVNFFDDMRLCNPICHEAAIIISNMGCSGLCDAVRDIPQCHNQEECRQDAASPLPFLASVWDNKDFEGMQELLS
jgi:hypothetical protein